MAEQEVIKHTKAVYKAWNNRDTSWQHKFKEILVEIVIIVFAITLSLWLHNWSEKNHNREEAHKFLEGLKTDLTNDIVQLQSDRATYERVERGTQYFSRVANGESLDSDSLNKHLFLFYNTTRFNANISRYEALKASGKLNILEDKELLNNIINYYQQTLVLLDMLNERFNTYKINILGNYLDEHIVFNKDGTNNWEAIIRTTLIKNALKRSNNINEIKEQYNLAIAQTERLLKEIEKAVE